MESVKIPLTQGYFATVDNENYYELLQYNWYIVKGKTTFYAMKMNPTDRGKRSGISMHRFIMNAKKEEQVDHIDHNGLNNTKDNLRICSVIQNKWNRRKCKIKTASKYKGVSWHGKKWSARIQFNKKMIRLGSFDTEEEAAVAYNQKAKELYKDFANLNII